MFVNEIGNSRDKKIVLRRCLVQFFVVCLIFIVETCSERQLIPVNPIIVKSQNQGFHNYRVNPRELPVALRTLVVVAHSKDL